MPESQSRLHYSWIVLAVATLVVFASLGLARFGYTAVLPAMQKGLAIDNTRAGILATANLTGYLLMALISGALATRFGPRRVIAAGLALAGVAMALTASAHSLLSASVWRFLTGAGSGASNVPAMALLSAWFAARLRGSAAGIGVAGSSLALIAIGPTAPLILGASAENGWRLCWLVFGGAALAVAAVALAFLRDRPAQLGILPLGADAGTAAAPPADAAPRWRDVYRGASVWHLGLVYTAFGFSYIIYMTFFVKRLMADGGYSREAAGRLFMVMGWASVLCGLIWGSVSDRIGRRGALIIVYVIQAAAFGLFALWPRPAGFVLSAVLFGLTAWSIPAIMAAACGDLLGPRLAPAALGFITLFFGVGQAVGPSVAGLLADASGSFASAFVLASAVALIGAFGSAFLRPPRQQQ